MLYYADPIYRPTPRTVSSGCGAFFCLKTTRFHIWASKLFAAPGASMRARHSATVNILIPKGAAG